MLKAPIDQMLASQLQEVKVMMQRQLESGDAYLNGSLDYLMKSGGKMLRPTFILIGSRMGKKQYYMSEELIKLATAVETIHMATLIHDDIIDEASYRRGQLSIQGKYGQAYAVYMGDYLLSQCFLMLTHLDLEKELAINLAKTVTRICVGDMKQNQMRFNNSITPYQYIKMVSGKTAALIAIAMSAGAFYAKAKKSDVKLLARIGYLTGMTFQLVDDLLDFEGEFSQVGKDVQMDIRRGYYSMPIIYALSGKDASADALNALLHDDMSEEDFNQALTIIKDTNAIEKTKALALRYHQKAMDLLESMEACESKTMLMTLLPSLVSRLY